MKMIPFFIGAFLLLGITLLWLCFPTSFSWCSNIWVTIGKPGFWNRLGYYVGFWVVIVFLAVRLGKSGPV